MKRPMKTFREVPTDRIRTLYSEYFALDSDLSLPGFEEHIKERLAVQAAIEIVNKMYEHLKIKTVKLPNGLSKYVCEINVIVPEGKHEHRKTKGPRP